MKHLKTIWAITFVLVIIVNLYAGIDIGIIHRFSNPELTETELQLYGLTKYWPLIIVDFIFVIVNYVVEKKDL